MSTEMMTPSQTHRSFRTYLLEVQVAVPERQSSSTPEAVRLVDGVANPRLSHVITSLSVALAGLRARFLHTLFGTLT